MGTARGVVRVRREALAACMTCPLCQGLLLEATAIAECLHTLIDASNQENGNGNSCLEITRGSTRANALLSDRKQNRPKGRIPPLGILRSVVVTRSASAVVSCLRLLTRVCQKCIMDKINNEEIDSCPVCNIDLGCDPEEKLRPDHNIQDVRNKVFPLKRAKADAPKAPSVTLPVKRKQRSLSSLVVDTPSVATRTGLRGRRTKATRRTASSRATPPTNNGTVKLPNKSEGRDQKTEKISAPQSTKMTTIANRKQNNTDIEASSQPSSEDRKNGKTVDKEELRKPLNSLVEAAGRTKSLRSSPKSHAAKEDKIKGTKCEVPIRKDDKEDEVAITGTGVSAHSNKLKIQGENNGYSSEPASSKDKITTEDNLRKIQLADSQQGLFGSTNTGALHHGVTTPVWFSLVASPNQKEDPQLPQLPKNYLRIKDGSLQISSIQRYIMNKLELASEDEVEIACHGEAICPLTTLQGLVELWLRSKPAEQVQASLGASAKKFVMVLGYRRRR